jgi:heterotetrameric sarcosine oxidase delta subunit
MPHGLRHLNEFVYAPAVSFLLTCPNCGVREVTDFGYGGEVSVRPAARPSFRELNAYNYFRANVAGVQREWWFHRSGCRAWFVAERDTRTNEVHFTALPGDVGGKTDPQTPDASKAGGAGVVT